VTVELFLGDAYFGDKIVTADGWEREERRVI
jgi:hypothetical protein